MGRKRLTDKQQAFINEYFLCNFNGTDAAARAGYKGNRATLAVIAHENLRKPKIAEEIEKRMKEHAMSADEVLARLADHARASMADFLHIDGETIDLQRGEEAGKIHLIKKFKRIETKDGERIEIELYDAQAALVHIGRHHQLFTDRVDVTSGGEPLQLSADDLAKLNRQADEELADFDANFEEGDE